MRFSASAGLTSLYHRGGMISLNMEFTFATTAEDSPKVQTGRSSADCRSRSRSVLGVGRTKSFGAIGELNSAGEDRFPTSSPAYGLISKVCQHRRPKRHGHSVQQDEEYETFWDDISREKRVEPGAIDSIPIEPKSTESGRVCCSECSDGILKIQEESSSEETEAVESIMKDWKRKSRSGAWTLVDEKEQLARILEVAQAHKDRFLEKKSGLDSSAVRLPPLMRDQQFSLKDTLQSKVRHSPYSPTKKTTSHHAHVLRAWSVIPAPAPSSNPRLQSSSLHQNSTHRTVASTTLDSTSATPHSGQPKSPRNKTSSQSGKQLLSGGKPKQATTAFWSNGKGGSKILRRNVPSTTKARPPLTQEEIELAIARFGRFKNPSTSI